MLNDSRQGETWSLLKQELVSTMPPFVYVHIINPVTAEPDPLPRPMQLRLPKCPAGPPSHHNLHVQLGKWSRNVTSLAPPKKNYCFAIASENTCASCNWEPYPFARLLTYSRPPCSPYIPWACTNGSLEMVQSTRSWGQNIPICAPLSSLTPCAYRHVSPASPRIRTVASISYSGPRHPRVNYHYKVILLDKVHDLRIVFLSFIHSSFRLLSPFQLPSDSTT